MLHLLIAVPLGADSVAQQISNTSVFAHLLDVVLSLLVFSGSVQFSAPNLWHASIACDTLALVALAVNARHVVMGAALSPWVVSAWLAIMLVSGVTLASRLSGPILMARLPMSTAVERFLQNLSLSVITALVASMLMRGGLREAASVTAAALVMIVFRKSIWAMGAGMLVAATWTLFVG